MQGMPLAARAVLSNQTVRPDRRSRPDPSWWPSVTLPTALQALRAGRTLFGAPMAGARRARAVGSIVALALLTCTMQPARLSADVWTFETPSQNIQCTVGEDFGGSDIDCTLIEYQSAPFVPRPAWCDSDWGHRFRMRDRGHVEMVCAPVDRRTGAQHVADYGVRGEFGGFTCLSSQQGLECRNLDGHGFFLSRGRQTLY